jgi:hypothetical protein
MKISPAAALVLAIGALLLAALPGSVKGPLFVVGAILVGFFGWKWSLHRRQLVRGTPTSQIATAAKGFAELQGRARNALDVPLLDPITSTPCVWFDVDTEKYDFVKLRWRTIASARSARPFAVEDDSGLCLVPPDTARVVTPKGTRIRERFGVRHTLKRIADGQPLYVMGHLERIDQGIDDATKPVAAPTASPDFERRVSALMRDWKRDPYRRGRMFDPNGDGTTDEAEMERARRAAREEVARRLPQPSEQLENAISPHATRTPSAAEGYRVDGRPVTHWMRRPDDDRPYILSTVPETELAARERRTGCGFLLLFIAFTVFALVSVAIWLGVNLGVAQ